MPDGWAEKHSKFLKGNDYAKGKHWTLSDATKQKHKDAGLARVNEEFIKFLSRINKGKPKSKEHRAKLSLVASAKIGPKNNNWHGGVSFLPYPPQFNASLKRRIEAKYNSTCQLCNADRTDNSIKGWAVHHIDYDKNNNQDDNFTFLCENCHNITNGAKHRDKWTAMFKEVIREEVVPNERKLLSLACAQ
jgi:5-methylcytosine-specific restriction endonuclease McrA